ncbi:MAG: hypothetical protein B7Z66_07900 [Chromatiales bacterium 21-64-14]|nr:MAG: hypothetical protein B7Z66_07900 [Chromatiales bacterium 21-64-14]HQU15978.1 DUF302 domain-containing protein [Gammaproteobacteria bacterium]
MKALAILLGCMLTFSAYAAPATVYEKSAKMPLDQAYTKVEHSLKTHKFKVVFQVPISKNISRFAKKWGANYNRNKLQGIRSMVFCNGWFANEVSNKDPAMLAVCPMHLTMYEKDGVTTVLFVRPSVVGAGTAAEPVLKKLEAKVTAAIDAGLK